MRIIAFNNMPHFTNKQYICAVMDNDINFTTYLASKNIDSAQFKSAEPELYEKLASLFEQMHPDSFTAQKLFLINPIRRKYLQAEKVEESPLKAKPKFKPKIK